MHALQKLVLFHVLTGLGPNALGVKIINGTIVPENLMKYMVSVQNLKVGHICGGFLISEDFVITAAHCYRSEPTHVVLGTHNLKKFDPKKKITIGRTYKHPQYHYEGYGKDIMLLKLSEKVQDNSVETVDLPSADMNVRENEPCQVAGWGKNNTYGTTVDDLRVADVLILNPDVCKTQWYHNVRFRLPDNIICAGGYNTTKGFCQGDSGGPLVCNGKAVGVVSFNSWENCNYPDVPNVYTDVSKYVKWINDIRKNNYE